MSIRAAIALASLVLLYPLLALLAVLVALGEGADWLGDTVCAALESLCNGQEAG